MNDEEELEFELLGFIDQRSGTPDEIQMAIGVLSDEIHFGLHIGKNFNHFEMIKYWKEIREMYFMVVGKYRNWQLKGAERLEAPVKG